MGSLSIWHWLIVLAIVVLVFGTGKLKNMGKDLGGAIKGFKEGMTTRSRLLTPRLLSPPTQRSPLPLRKKRLLKKRSRPDSF